MNLFGNNIDQYYQQVDQQVKDDDQLQKLSPRQIVRKQKPASGGLVAIESNDGMEDHFVCQICFKLVLDPKECSGCNTPYCKDCIEKWSKIARHCPNRCENARYIDMHRLVKQQLLDMRFYCTMEQCEYHKDAGKGTTTAGGDQGSSLMDEVVVAEKQEQDNSEKGLSYEAALKHLRTCPYRPQYCRNGCGKKLLKRDIEEHEKVCPEYQVQCPKCEQFFKPNKPGSTLKTHNCIEFLKSKLKQNQKEKQEIFKELGINYDKVNVKCVKGGHQLQVHRGYVCKYLGQNQNHTCKGCGRQELNKYDMFYTCKNNQCNCQYDLCRLCALQMSKPPLIPKEGILAPNIHPRPLKIHEANTNMGWRCDSNNCEMDITRFHLTRYVYGLQNRDSDFDICLKCFVKKADGFMN